MCVHMCGCERQRERQWTPVNLLEEQDPYCVCVQQPGGQASPLQGNLLSEPLAYLEPDDIINNQNC